MGNVCVCVFIKLHITAQPGPVKLIFQCYSNGSALWGISVYVCCAYVLAEFVKNCRHGVHPVRCVGVGGRRVRNKTCGILSRRRTVLTNHNLPEDASKCGYAYRRKIHLNHSCG